MTPASDRSLPSTVVPRFKIIYLELTNACNFTCDYCPIDQQSRKKVHMPAGFARRIIDEIAEHHLTRFLTFHLMGEPFLHKDLCLLTGYAEARGIKVRLLTNGSLLERKRNEGLFENHLSRLEVGFRTPNDTAFNLRLRGGSLSLDDYIQRVKGLIDDKIRLAAETEICIKLFIRSHGAALKLSDPYEHLTSEADNVRMGQLFQAHCLAAAEQAGVPTTGWRDVTIRTTDGEYPIFEGITLGFSRIQEFWVREQRGHDTERYYPAVVGGCSAGFRDDFGILANGDVTTCCVDYDGKNVIGNLHDRSLMDVLDSDPATRIRRSLARFRPPTPFCRACLGGPTRASSLLKQASTIASDVRDRLAPRKAYRSMLERLSNGN